MSSFRKTVILSSAIALIEFVPGIPAMAGSPVIRWTPPPPPPTTTEPKTLPVGGGRRGPCKPYEKLVALVPSTPSGTLWGQTTRDRFTLWVYAPQGFEKGVVRKITLEDAQGRRIANHSVRPDAVAAGISKLEMPSAIAPLQAGTTYRWKFDIYCDSNEPDTPLTVQGLIKTVTLPDTIQQQITAETISVAKAKLYAENGIWFDALTTIGEYLQTHRHSSTPKDHQAWSQLLEQAGLKQLKEIPIVSQKN